MNLCVVLRATQRPVARPRMNAHRKVISYVGRIVARHVAGAAAASRVIFPRAIFRNFPNNHQHRLAFSLLFKNVQT